MLGRHQPSKETVAIAAAMCVVATLVIVAPAVAIMVSIFAAVALGIVLAFPWPGKRPEEPKPDHKETDEDWHQRKPGIPSPISHQDTDYMSTIEYFYVAHSAFAFVGSAKLTQVATATNRRIDHRPIDLHRVMAAQSITSFAERDAVDIRYFFRREIWRWAEFRGVEISDRRPSHHGNDYGLANRVLIASIIEGENTDRLAHAFLVGHWRDDADLADRASLARYVDQTGGDPETLLAKADTRAVAELYEANTQEAIRRRIYGSPTYFVDGDMFYGQDHLELVERACRRPFGPSPE